MIGCGGLCRFLMKSSGTTELNAFYPIRAECQGDVPAPRFKPRAGKTLSQRRWQASFSEDGHLDIAKVLRRIQRGVTFVVYLHSVFVSPFVFGFAITLKTLVQLHDPFPIVRRLYQ